MYAAFAKLITLTSILSRTEGEQVGAYAITFDEKIYTVVASTLPADTERIFGEDYLRFSVANSIEKIEQALVRIDAWTKKICRATTSVAIQAGGAPALQSKNEIFVL